MNGIYQHVLILRSNWYARVIYAWSRFFMNGLCEIGRVEDYKCIAGLFGYHIRISHTTLVLQWATRIILFLSHVVL